MPPSRLLTSLSGFCLMLNVLAGAAFAQDCPAIPGFDPLADLQVYEGSCLFGAADDGFATFALPTGPMKSGAPVSSVVTEGQVQRRLYVAPEGASPTDVFANYQQSLAASGFESLFTCTGRACGSNNALLGKLVIYPAGAKFDNLGQTSEFAMYIDGDEHFLAARSADGDRLIAVYVARNQNTAITGAAAGRAAVHLTLVTTEALNTRMVDAAAMAKGIIDDGHIAVDNIYFDFGTADLSPDSAPALAEMVKFLTSSPDLKVYIVGHTDTVGGPDSNLLLSQRRAESVVAALLAYGIAADRLAPAGVGLFAPRASNDTDAGRALNRRVEMVAQ